LSQSSPLLTPYQRQALFWGTVALGLGILLWLLSPVLTPFLLGAILAYILQPGVAWLVRHRVPRGIAALLMMLVFALLVSLLALLVFAVVQKEGPQLKAQIPALISHLHDWAQPKLTLLGFADVFDFSSLRDMLTTQFESSAQTVALAAWKSLRTSSNLMITLIGDLVMVPLVLYYLLYDWNTMLARLAGIVPRRWLPKTLELVVEMDRTLSQYLRGQLLVMAVLAVPFALSGGRRGALSGVVVALVIGVSYVLTSSLFEAMGNVSQLPPLIAAWSPDLIFGLAGGYLIMKTPS